jgi:hypothetical protein
MKTDPSLLSTITPLLDEAMLELRSADREALLLRYFAQKSLREVGATLGIKEDAAQKRVSKALDALAERFRQRGFRVGGAAALALALEQSSAHAIPAGLALSTTQAALSAGAAASLGSMTMPIVKFMSLTKIQTAALCVSLAAVPLGYQWHALDSARSTKEQFAAQLQALRSDALAQEQGRARAQHRLDVARNALARKTAPNRPGRRKICMSGTRTPRTSAFPSSFFRNFASLRSALVWAATAKSSSISCRLWRPTARRSRLWRPRWGFPPTRPNGCGPCVRASLLTSTLWLPATVN